MNPAEDEQSADQHRDRDPELYVTKDEAHPTARAHHAWIVAHGGQYCIRSVPGRNDDTEVVEDVRVGQVIQGTSLFLLDHLDDLDIPRLPLP